ncbi:Uncharacterised protein [Klebsiella aerogenes]|nr:Uncharacterised protein [Klebsiella aerogenes]
MIETQRRGQHGGVGQLHVVLSEQREDFRLRVRAAASAVVARDGAARQRLGIGGVILHPLLVPLAAQRQVLINQIVERDADFAVQHHIRQIDIRELVAVKDPLGAPGQAFAFARVAGAFVLRPVAGGHPVVPGAVPGDRVGVAVQTVGLFTVVLFHQVVGVGVLGVAGVEVALAAVARLKTPATASGRIPSAPDHRCFYFVPLRARQAGCRHRSRYVRTDDPG